MKYVSYLDGSNEFSKEVNWDYLAQKLILKNYKNNWAFCDVGSSEGEYCKFFNSLENVKTIYSFDINENNPTPVGSNHEIIAVSDIDGTESFYLHNNHPSKMSNIIGIDVDGIECNFVKTIPSIRLDTYFKDININCLKIDVEGSELKVIKGGINTIKKCNIVIIECHLDKDWDEIYKLFQENNLEFFGIHDNEKIKPNVRPYQIYKINE